MVSRFTPHLVRLALAIAEKIVGKAVGEDSEIVASVLERAKKEVPDARLVRVRLHPADYKILAELRPELVRAGEEGGRKVEVLAADEIGRGGCRIETEIGVVDASLPTQFQEIKRQLLDE
jgi:flagellar biosynthesis/type III secretory pathway protein FliH